MTTGNQGRQSFRKRFRGWRRSRPFWAGFLTILSGSILSAIPLGGLKFTFIQGSVIWAALLVGLLVILCGFTLWAGGQYHFFVGGLIIIFSLVAIVTSDIGGFLLGTILGVIGGSMAVAWIPGNAQPPKAAGASGGALAVATRASSSTETTGPQPDRATLNPAIDALTVQELIPSLWERVVSDLRPERGQPTLPQPS